ncbi:MAG: hypothetical protein H6816_12580 [Phycisphaerales bacterium]|nr:hypothetical protein [Phycisphaerales bacterium]
MKGLITFAVVAGLLVTAGYFVMGKYLMSDTGELIAFACGNANGDLQEIQIVVPIAYPKREPPRVEVSNGYVFWDEWIEQHYIVTSKSGERIALERRFAGNLIPDAKVGTPDSYLIGHVKTGEEYQFDFVPSLAEGKRYRRTFRVEGDGKPFRRETFEFVEDG